MSSHVAWISRISFMLGQAVGGHGVGCVVRNIAANIMTRPLARNHRRRRTITLPVVGKRLASRKKTIALEDIILIVERDGRPRSGQPSVGHEVGNQGLNPKYPFYTR